MVGLQLVSMAGAADTLKVFAPVRIASLQSPNQSRWHDMVYMAADARLLEVHAARQYLTRPM